MFRLYSKQPWRPLEHLSPKLIRLVLVDPTGSSSTDIIRVVGVCSKVDGRTMSGRTSRIFVVARIPAGDHGTSGAREAGARHVSPRVATLGDSIVTMGTAVLGVFRGAVVGRLPASVARSVLDSHERDRGDEVRRVSALARDRSL